MALDASALLAYVRDEPGAEAVDRALEEGASVSAPNWAEVLIEARRERTDSGGYGPGSCGHRHTGGIAARPPARRGAGSEKIARLRPLAREAWLSLADRACLALVTTLGSPALTADGAWAELDVGPQRDLIR